MSTPHPTAPGSKKLNFREQSTSLQWGEVIKNHPGLKKTVIHMDFSIRPLEPDDQPFLWMALYHAIHIPPGEPALLFEIVHDPTLARYADQWMQRPGDVGLIAEVKGEPVGAAWLRRWSKEDHGFAFIDEATPELSMSVIPDHRGQGIGTQLLRELMAIAAKHHHAVSLSVSKTNPAWRLYERQGFVPVKKCQGDSVTMVINFGDNLR